MPRVNRRKTSTRSRKDEDAERTRPEEQGDDFDLERFRPEEQEADVEMVRPEERLDALDSIVQAEYWKERALDAINKNKILEEKNEKLESDVYAWERRTKRIEKRSERLQKEIEELTKTAGRRKSISNNFEVSTKELEEVERNPSSDLRKLMQSSFRNKWSKKKLAGVKESIDDDEASVGAETAAARKYINEYLESNPQGAKGSPVNLVIDAEKRSDRSTRSAPEKTTSSPRQMAV
jgi:hypothetical protein